MSIEQHISKLEWFF